MRVRGRSGTVSPISGEVIRLDEVTKSYQAGGPPALAGVSLSVTAGEVVAIMGPSGSGKSTLLNLITGLDRPSQGRVIVAGQRIDRLSESALARFRARHTGIVFQFFNLLDPLTVEDNVRLPAQLAGASRRQARARARELLARMRIEQYRNAYPARMSGGRRQRVGLALALGHAPARLVADEPSRGPRVPTARPRVTAPGLRVPDEPTGALDPATGHEIAGLLRELNHEGQTLVLVTHDRSLARQFAARTVELVDGQLA